MKLSTKGRYGLRALIDLAVYCEEEAVSIQSIAKRQNISLKYLEQILPSLTKNGMIEGLRRKGGGYKLTAEPGAYRVGDILRLTEGDLAPVACLCREAKVCERAESCKTLPMWKEFYRMTNAYFDGITLLELMG